MNIGIIAGIIMGSSYIPYIASILKGQTRPERGSRVIWTTLAVVALYSQYSAGGTDSLWLTVALFVCGIVTSLLSITRGEYGMTARDIHIYLMTFIVVLVSVIYKNPLLSLTMVVFIDGGAQYLTARKVIEEPYSESMASYVIGATGAILAIPAVGEINITLLLYPVYLVLSQFVVVGIMYKRRRFAPAYQ